MIYTRKFMFLILVISLFGFCFNSFAQECKCSRWDRVAINWWEPPHRIVSTLMSCEESVCMCNVCQCCPISLTFKYFCTPVNCPVSYTWTISGPNGYSLSSPAPTPSGYIQFIPTVAGLYSITVTPTCGHNDCSCRPCTIEVNVREIVQCSPPCFHPGLSTEEGLPKE